MIRAEKRERISAEEIRRSRVPSLDLLRVVLRPDHQVFEIGEDAHHLRAGHGIAAVLGPPVPRRDVLDVASHVVPTLVSP